MPFETWLAFAAASAVLVAIPGPTILLVISYAIGHGRRAALPTVAGVALGDFTAMTASMLGLGALLAASAELFLLLKWIGAAYLIYLGVKLWRAPVVAATLDEAAVAKSRPDIGSKMFWHAFAVTALNPKSIIFFVAFLPQFLTPGAPLVTQMVIMEATFVLLAVVNAALYASAATAARGAIASPRVQQAVNRTGGSLLIGAGVFAATTRS